MHHYTYLTTDLETYEFYVGVRSCVCDPKDDPYLGSGTIISSKVKRHGAARFHKLVLRTFPTRDDADIGEAEHVTEKWLAEMRPLGALNLRPGGNRGRFGHKNPLRSPKQIAQQQVWSLKGQKAAKGRVLSDEHREASGRAWLGKKRGPQSLEHRAKLAETSRNRVVSDETRAKVSAAAKASWAKRKAHALNEQEGKNHV